MSINPVHTDLQRMFPKVDPFMLRFAAYEQSNDLDAAVKVLDEIFFGRHKRSVTSLHEYEAPHDCDSGYIQNEAAIQIDLNIPSMTMSEKDTLAVEMVNSEDVSTLNSLVSNSGKICGTELLDTAIDDARKNKETLVLTMESVMNLMREVERKEKEAEQAKEEAASYSSHILAKVDELKQARQLAKEANDKHARKVYARREILASNMKELQHRVVSLSDEGDRSLGVLNEICRALEMRFTAALIKKEEASTEKLEKEIAAQQALAYHESEMKKLVEESKRLKQESFGNYKLQKFLKDRAHVVDKLHQELSVNCQNVNLVKEELDQVVTLSALLSSSRLSSKLASSDSSLTTVDSYETSKVSARLAVFAEDQPYSENTTLNLEYQEGNKNRETEMREIHKTLQSVCEGRKCKNLKKVIKRRVKVVPKKRNQSGTKNIKNEEMKRRIMNKGIKRRVVIHKVKVIPNERKQWPTKIIKNEEIKRRNIKKRLRRTAVSKVKVALNKNNRLLNKDYRA